MMDRFQITPHTYVGLNGAKHIIFSERKDRFPRDTTTNVYLFSLKEKTTTAATTYYWVQVFQNAVQMSKCYLHKKDRWDKTRLLFSTTPRDWRGLVFFLFCTYGVLIVPFSLSSSNYIQQLLRKKRYVHRKQTNFYLHCFYLLQFFKPL